MKPTDNDEDSLSENNSDKQSLENISQESDASVTETSELNEASIMVVDKEVSENQKASEENHVDEQKSQKYGSANRTESASTATASFFSKRSLVLLAVLVSVFLALFLGARWVKIYVADLDNVSQEQSKQQAIAQKKLKSLEDTLAALSQKYEQSQEQVLTLKKDITNDKKQSDARLRAAEERLQAQNRRLLSLSTTTREDWLLAEAEYLLKLANQRVAIEKSPENAIALLEETDNILRNLADPDLYSVRQVLLRDISSLKLIDKIDQEGLYLSLLALAQQVDSLPVQPEYISDQIEKETLTDLDTNSADEVSSELFSETLLEKIGRSFSNFIDSVKGSFNIVDYNETAMTMVSPQTSKYMKQNLRLMIERAQLALLREQSAIYQSSLTQAISWLVKYFPRSDQRQVFIQEINVLAQKNIVRNMPHITGSLDLLSAYIEELHQLQGNPKHPLNTPQTELLSEPNQGGEE